MGYRYYIWESQNNLIDSIIAGLALMGFGLTLAWYAAQALPGKRLQQVAKVVIMLFTIVAVPYIIVCLMVR
jgi:hypothetical protein